MRTVAIALVLLSLNLVQAQEPVWTYANGPFAGGSVYAVHPNGAVISVRDGYFLISWNEGETWTVRSEEPINPRRLKLLDGDDLLALGATGVIRSNDFGRTWGTVGLDGTLLRHLALDPDGIWYATSDTLLYRSGDQGASWVALPGDFAVPHGSLRTLVAFGEGVLLTAWYNSASEYGELRRSTDDGATWEIIEPYWTDGGPLVRNEDGSLFLPSQSRGPFTTSPGLWESQDDGITWTRIYAEDALGARRLSDGKLVIGRPFSLSWDGPALEASVTSIVEGEDGVIFANTGTYYQPVKDPPFPVDRGTGAYRFDPSSTRWIQVGTIPTAVTALAVQEDSLYVGTGSALLRAESGVWSATGFNDGINALLTLEDGRLVIGGVYPHSAQVFGEPSPIAFAGGDCLYNCSVTALAATDSDALLLAVDEVFYIGSHPLGIHRRNGPSGGWTQVLSGVDNVRVLAAGPMQTHFAGTHGQGRFGMPGAGVYRSDDDGQTWSVFTDGLTNTEVHALVAPSGVLAFAGTDDGVFVSTGGAWTADGLAGDTVYAFAEAEAGLLAGTSSGLYRRSGAGAWQRYGTGLDGREARSLLVTTWDDAELIVVGTDAGVYLSRPGLITTDREVEAPSPSRHVLHPPAPNPARETVGLTFDLAEPSTVRLRVFDVLGREVATPLTGRLPAGRHTRVWAPVGLASGLYVVRLETETAWETQTLVLAR